MRAKKTAPLSTRNAVETAIDMSKMSGTWAKLLGWAR